MGGGNRTDVLGRRAEGLPVRDVGIASLDALDFVPAIVFPGPEEEPEKEKRKGRRQIDAHMISRQLYIYRSWRSTTLALFAITDASFAVSH